MKKLFIIKLFIGAMITTSCVSTKVFNDIESRYAALKMDRNAIEKSRDSIQQSWEFLEDKRKQSILYLKRSRDSVLNGLKSLKNLKKKYVFLEQNSSQKIQESIGVNNALLKEIAIKEAELLTRSERVDQLEKLISEQKEALLELKQRLSDALLNFEGKGLTVEQRNGKVYVSMENKLLFNSGSWNVGREGQRALGQLGNVLADNPDIVVMIEGHTDNISFSQKGALESNWDLSTKRATSVVNILLQNELILPQNLTAAGRSEYIPVAPNSNVNGRAVNRRIEVILSPQWDEINALLNN